MLQAAPITDATFHPLGRRQHGIYRVKHWLAAVLAVFIFLGIANAKADQLSADDEKIYRQAFIAAGKGRYDLALATAGQARDRLPAKVLQWQAFLQPNSGASFTDITAFMAANPDWPLLSVLERRAEEALAGTPDTVLISWFAQHPPMTTDGVIAYAKALQAGGDPEKTARVVRAAWAGVSFTQTQEQDFLTAFQTLLTDADETRRLDRLLWEHQDEAAGRQIQRVPADLQRLAEARLALAADTPAAEAALERVPSALAGDPGLTLERIRYLRRHDREDEALALLAAAAQGAAGEPGRPDQWWTERAILVRRLLQKNRNAEAYDAARAHGLTSGTAFADAEWLSGWIALRFLGDDVAAMAHFSRMYDRVGTPQSRSRAAYWAGRAADAMGHDGESTHWYALAAGHVTTFYGQLAAWRLNPGQLWPLPPPPTPTAEDTDRFEQQELVRAARLLGQLQQGDLIRPLLLRVGDTAGTPGLRTLTAGLAASLGRPDVAVAIAKRLERDGTPLITAGYPIPRVKAPDAPERALVMGVIRQESAFQEDVISPVGARGLMQLMPATAQRVAKGLNLPSARKDTLTDALTTNPGLNVTLGSAYLNGLLSDFDGSYILAVASYNAGPNRVRKWIRDMGDPRGKDADPIDWIESIPYPETRNYVQRVLEGAQIYRRRLGVDDVDLSLASDLKR